jgi:UDP-GlcNAc:undecaprenyl-phosphate/decaprenyl-phosphate GlcNAc-1-phosphate transferase
VTTRVILLPIVAVLTSVLLTGVIIQICKRKRWVVEPRPDRWHRKPVAQFGGIAIVGGFLLAGSFAHPHPRLLAVFLLTVAIAAVGLCDDVWSWKPRTRLAAEFAIAIATVSFGVIYPLRIANWVNICFTVVWIVGITNAFNLLDNMDGLAAGIGIVAGLTLAFLTPNPSLQLLTLIFVAALGGVLVFNFKPPKIWFLGLMDYSAFYQRHDSGFSGFSLDTAPQIDIRCRPVFGARVSDCSLRDLLHRVQRPLNESG